MKQRATRRRVNWFSAHNKRTQYFRERESVDETHEMSMKENEQSRCVFVQKFTFEGEIKKV